MTNIHLLTTEKLTHHAFLRSMAMVLDKETVPDLPLNIIVRPNKKWFSKTIVQLPNIEKATDLATLEYGNPELEHVCFPGPLFRCALVFIEETQCAGILYSISHSLFDGVSLQMFLDDLEATLLDTTGTSKLKPVIPYKAWADSYHNLQASPQARASVAWQVNRLQGISKNPSALFPARRAPGDFKGDATGWRDPAGNLGPPRKKLNPNDEGQKGLTRLVNMADMQMLKTKHNIDTPQILRAALAVITVRHTQQPYALFCQSQGGRNTWPFMPAWQADRMPSTMQVAGPTVQTALIKAHVREEETILDLLTRLQSEQEDTTRHVFAPWEQVISSLNDLCAGEGDFVAAQLPWGRQVFNWLPYYVGENEYKALQKVQFESRVDCFLCWNGVPRSQTSVLLQATWDDAQLYLDEVEGMMGEIARLAENFAKSENWQRAVGDFI